MKSHRVFLSFFSKATTGRERNRERERAHLRGNFTCTVFLPGMIERYEIRGRRERKRTRELVRFGTREISNHNTEMKECEDGKDNISKQR